MSGQCPEGYMEARDKYVVFLEITSWVGISGGAEHVYGKLKGCIDGKRVEVELERVIDKKLAKYLNQKDYGKDKWNSMWEAGDTTIRFDTVQELSDLAMKVFKKKFPNGKVLIEGRCSYLDPEQVLIAPAELKRQANAIYKAVEKFGRWEGDEKKMEIMSAKWESLFMKWFTKWNEDEKREMPDVWEKKLDKQ